MLLLPTSCSHPSFSIRFVPGRPAAARAAEVQRRGSGAAGCRNRGTRFSCLGLGPRWCGRGNNDSQPVGLAGVNCLTDTEMVL